LTPAWDIPAVAAALGSNPELRTDAVLGRGIVFRLGAAPPIDLELYEQARTVRMTGGDVQIALFNQDGPTIAPDGVVFELRSEPRHRFVAVTPGGDVSLRLAPPRRMPPEASDASKRAHDPPLPSRSPQRASCDLTDHR
jgi:hypothetical protein